VIALRGVTEVYGAPPAAVRALDHIDLSVPAGSYLAMTGRSGSGKSTLLAVLGCVERPTAGRYELHHQDVSSLSDGALSRLRARHFGFVFQAFHLLPERTALANVLLPMRYGPLPRRQWRAHAETLLERVGLADKARQLAKRLSGGEQQRVAIARALANAPSVVVADEPTGNLDSRTRDEVVALLEAYWREGHTLILVTHDEALAARASHRVALQDGRLVAS
jgi:putative ABC transport system ATP-binding protein